ncbi:MAG: hypothetical protein J5787_10025 [Alphaproteobacteria bacterium]|nr:hypothetical protein [Alphaproteobacteria bacterium]
MKQIKPHQQGTIDYFCGVYAVINAFRWAAKKHKKLSYKESCLFYQYLISFLLKKDLFAEVLHSGSSCRILSKIIKRADKYTRKTFSLSLSVESPFARTKKSVSAALGEIGDFLKLADTAWIIRLNNQTIGDHWSVGTKIASDNRVCLFDSYGYAGFDANKAVWVPAVKEKDKTPDNPTEMPDPPKGKTYLLKEGQLLLTVKRV